MYKIVDYTHHLIIDYLNEQKLDSPSLCDATCGNGNDTLFLAKAINGNGHIDAYDIQEIAIENTIKLLKENNIDNVDVIHSSFENIDPSKYDLILFNLGYLPKGNKNITTTVGVTIPTLNRIIKEIAIKINLFLIVAVYPGHREGRLESDEIQKMIRELDSSIYYVSKYHILNQIDSPYVITISNKKNKV